MSNHSNSLLNFIHSSRESRPKEHLHKAKPSSSQRIEPTNGKTVEAKNLTRALLRAMEIPPQIMAPIGIDLQRPVMGLISRSSRARKVRTA